MGYYANLNNDVMAICSKVNSSLEMRKLLCINERDATSSTIIPPDNIMYDKIFPVWKTVDVEAEASSFCFIYFDEITKPSENNIYFRDIKVYIDLITHIDIAPVDEGNRLYAMMEQIDKLLNREFVTSLKSLTGLKFAFSSPMTINKKFVGQRACYRYTVQARQCT